MSSIDKKLLKAYSSLIKKGQEKLNVSVLCEKADIARATFYMRYTDFDDFVKAIQVFIVDKFLEKALFFMFCAQKELDEALKENHPIFDESETVIFKSMVGENNYTNFAVLADKLQGMDKFMVFPPAIQEKYKTEIGVFHSGYLAMLVYGIVITEDVEKLKKDIVHCRNFFEITKQMIFNAESE